MTESEFVEKLPPVAAHRNSNPAIPKFAAALRTRPDVWARWPYSIRPGTVGSYTTKINTGQMPAFRDWRFQARAHAGVLYVRYLGEDGAQ